MRMCVVGVIVHLFTLEFYLMYGFVRAFCSTFARISMCTAHGDSSACGMLNQHFMMLVNCSYAQ